MRCPVFPTEDPEKVLKACLGVFPGIRFSHSGGGITGVSEERFALECLREKIISRRILDSFRNALLSSVAGNAASVWLNKQAAFAGRANLEESNPPLGCVEVKIEDESIISLIDWLSPRTENGLPVLDNSSDSLPSGVGDGA